jgi:RHS repeat-associated protein
MMTKIGILGHTTFTGKERDEETGYGYFGARYMDHELMTMWLSVDPMADKYPSISPYAYCAWNPVRLVDPDGREVGDYYTRDGKWVGRDKWNDNKVYICDGKDDKGDFLNAQDLKITHSAFRKKAATVYGESSAYRYSGNTVPEDLRCEMFAIAYVHERNDKAYGANSQKAKDFLNQTPEQNNSNNFRTTANAAVINALTGGPDYSNGATQWDGMEQALYPESENRCHVDGYELHMNTMGWKISDEHYSIWKANVGERFKAPQEKKAVAGKLKGEMGLRSTAVYCRTIFWELTK